MAKHPHYPMIRPLNPHKDLLAIADLIELCFSETLDQNGRDYIHQLRQIARGGTLYWIGGSSQHIFTPREGFVWEEDGKIVGNLSIFPFHTSRGVEYLIANVAVHPDYRRRGIARLLTEHALENIRQRGGRQAWLNVRDDNQAAYNLYRGLEFSERLRRTHWQFRPNSNDMKHELPKNRAGTDSSIQVRRRQKGEWETQRQWLLINYPMDYHWHLDFHLDWFAPGFFSWLRGITSENRYQHFSISKAHQLIGVATLQSNAREEQFLWMACAPQWENEAFQAFLSYIFNTQMFNRTVTLDYPAQRATHLLQEFGFTPVQTLIWMHRSLTPTII